jgi:hypothetical protein
MKRKLQHMIMHDTVQLLYNLKIGHIKREENLRENQEFLSIQIHEEKHSLEQ